MGVVMRRVLISLLAFAVIPVAAASAADMAVKTPPAAPAPYVPYNWTGFYVGGEFGAGWGNSQTTVVTNSGVAFPPGTVENTIDYFGGLGGVYGGYNYQINQFLIGIDGDYTWAAVHGNATNVSLINGDISNVNDHIDWVATLTGRIGWAIDRLLVFGKGGWAWAGFTGDSSTVGVAGNIESTTASSENRSGWTVGGGVEWLWTPHVSFKAEYDYVKFDTANFNVAKTDPGAPALSGTFQRSATSNLNMFKAGLAYKF
jgi:outer membrane immunogenic protein